MNRILINTLKNIRRSPYQAVAAIMILTLTLFIAQLFILLSHSSQRVLEYFETKPQVTAFFKDAVIEADILALKQQLENQDYVEAVVYVSKQDALKIYQQQNADDPLLLEMVTADILPASLEVSAKTVDNLPIVRQTLENTAGVEEVIYQEDVIEALQRWTTGIRIGGVVLVAILITTSLLVITIIISIKASSKRQEISTMKLLGATPLFIRGPFMFEGIIYAVLSAFMAWGLVYIILLYSTPTLLNFLGDVPLLPISPIFMLEILLSTAAAASFMGMWSGYFSSRRFGQ
jgi:cell division transport system permease protein